MSHVFLLNDILQLDYQLPCPSSVSIPMSMLSFAEVPVVPLSRNGDEDVIFLARRRVG